MSAKAKAVLPTKSVKIQKMITAGSTHYTGWGCGGHEDRDREPQRDQDVARAVCLGHRVEPDPVRQGVEVSRRAHHGVLAQVAVARQRAGELGGHGHPATVRDDHYEVQRRSRRDEPDAWQASEMR